MNVSGKKEMVNRETNTKKREIESDFFRKGGGFIERDSVRA